MNSPDSILRPELPAFSEFQWEMVFRAMGDGAAHEGLGAGFLHKNRHIDMRDLRFPRFVLVMVLRGGGLYLDADGREYPLSRGSTFVRLPGIAHSNYVEEESGYVELYLELGPRLYAALSEMNILKTAPPVHRIELADEDELPRRVWRFMVRLAAAGESELAGCAGEMVALLGEIRRRGSAAGAGRKHVELVDSACRRLGTEFDRSFSLPKFCRAHAIGYENFRKIFRVQTGVSPWRYRIRRRMEAACLLLRNEELTLGEIALRLGYRSPYEFSAQFKREIGVSPLHFRRGR